MADIKWAVNDTIDQDIQSGLSIQLIKSLSFNFHVNLFFNRKFPKFQKTMENEKVANTSNNSEVQSPNSLKDTRKHLTARRLQHNASASSRNSAVTSCL